MNKQLPIIAAALALACLSTTASADEARVFAFATFGDTKFGYATGEYGWGSGSNIFTVGATLGVSGTGEDSEFDLGINAGYTYLFNPEGNTGFVEGRGGTFDIGAFSDSAFYELSAGYRWYVSDRAAIGWNIVGYQQLKSDDDWDGSPFTRLQLIVALD